MSHFRHFRRGRRLKRSRKLVTFVDREHARINNQASDPASTAGAYNIATNRFDQAAHGETQATLLGPFVPLTSLPAIEGQAADAPHYMRVFGAGSLDLFGEIGNRLVPLNVTGTNAAIGAITLRRTSVRDRMNVANSAGLGSAQRMLARAADTLFTPGGYFDTA